MLTRLFRRPVTNAQLQRYVSLVKCPRCGRGLLRRCHADGTHWRDVFQEFLYRQELPGRLDDWAVASRLSYLLWDTAPDDVLLDLAPKANSTTAAK